MIADHLHESRLSTPGFISSFIHVNISSVVLGAREEGMGKNIFPIPKIVQKLSVVVQIKMWVASKMSRLILFGDIEPVKADFNVSFS